PGLGTTAVPCTAPSSPPRAPGPPNEPPPGGIMRHGPPGGKCGLTEGEGDGDGEAPAPWAACPDELVAATATPAPASTPTAPAPRHDREPAGALPCRPQARLARLRVVIVFWASRHGKPLLSGPFGRARPGALSGRIPRKVEGMLSSSAKFPRQAAR